MENTENPNWPKFRYSWEQSGFGKYFKFALNGRSECTIWDYLTEVYRYKFIQACFFGLISGVLVAVLALLLYFEMGELYQYLTLFMAFNFTFFTGTCVMDVRLTRRQIMAYWEEFRANRLAAEGKV